MTEDQWIDGVDEISINMLTHATKCSCKSTQGCAKCNTLRHNAQMLETICQAFLENLAEETVANGNSNNNRQPVAEAETEADEIDILALGDAAILPMAKGGNSNPINDLSQQQLRSLGIAIQDDDQLFYE